MRTTNGPAIAERRVMTARDGGPHLVVAGGGFAGFYAARVLAAATRGAARVSLVNSTDYFLYLPLLPEVATAILDPRDVAIPLAPALPGVSCVLSEVCGVDVGARRLALRTPEGRGHELGYDLLVVAVGSVNKLVPIPGVTRIAHGLRGLPEALYLRDHIIRQIELAELAADPAERAARCTFVVVGAGYTGTELAAQGALFTAELHRAHPALRDQRLRWLLLDLAPRVLPELDQRLSATAERVLRGRGVEVMLGTSIVEASAVGVRLTTGETVPTRSLAWCVGVRPDPLVEELGLPAEKGRLVVDEHLVVPGHPELFGCGDAAAVPDPVRPGALTAMTAQHATRQGKLAARNVVATLRGAPLRPYRHRDLGFLVDLGGWQAAANPLGHAISGLPAGVLTRGHHLVTMPGNRLRTATDWALAAVQSRQAVQLGLVRSGAVPLDSAAPELPAAPPRVD